MVIGICLAGIDDLLFGVPRNSALMARRDLIEENLTRSVIGAFFEVYNNLGFGFLEHLYVMALERELLARGHNEYAARQLYNYLRATNLEVGLLLHFGPKASFHREISLNRRSNQINPPNPPNPSNPPS